MKREGVDDSLKEFQSFCSILNPIMTINASITILNQMHYHSIDDDVKRHLEIIKRSIDRVYEHLQEKND